MAASSDGTKVVAAPYDGDIYTSTDSGVRWIDRTAGTSLSGSNWAALASSADGTHLAATRYGDQKIYVSTDSGATWTDRSGGLPWYSFAFIGGTDNLVGIACPASDCSTGSNTYTSTNNGATWSDQTPSGPYNLISLVSSGDGSTLAAIGCNTADCSIANANDIYTSTTTGATWTNDTAGTSLSGLDWGGIISSSDGTHLAAFTVPGDIYTSTNSGVTWTNRTTGTSLSGLNWTTLAYSANGLDLFAGMGCGFTVCTLGDIQSSTNDGATWTAREMPPITTSYWDSITSSSDGAHLTAGVNGGDLYTSTDGGTTWTNDTTGTGASGQFWADLTSSSDGEKLAASTGSFNFDGWTEGSGDIYTSDDGGSTWTDQTASESRYWDSITSSSDGTKLAATGYGWPVYTSPDSGATWIASGPTYFFDGSVIASSADGTKLVLAGTDNDIYTSTNSGATWTNRTTGTSLSGLNWISVTSSSDGSKLAAVAGSGPNVNGVGPGGDIYTSTDSGATWTNQTTGTSLSGLNWSSITSSSNGEDLAASVYDGDIYTSDDGGATWTDQTVGTELSGLNWTSLSSSADGAKLAATVYGGFIYTGVIPQTSASGSAAASSGGGGMIVGSGPLAPSAASFFNLTPPVFQIIFPNSKVVYPATTTTSVASSSPAGYVFSKNRQLNDAGSDILALQQFLNTHGFQLAPSGSGSTGHESDYFGAKTYQALVKIQQSNTLPATGYFGPLTRAVINAEVR